MSSSPVIITLVPPNPQPFKPMQPASEFLTAEECAEVDKALLTAHDKFATRVAIYALRSLKRIAQEQGKAIASLTPEQIEDWVYQDESLQGGTDREFRQFFSKLVIAAQTPLKLVATETNKPIEDLSIQAVISWFEKEAKQKLNQSSTHS